MSGESSDARRHYKRRHLAYFMKVYDDQTGERLGHLVNITHNGVMLVSTDEIQPDLTIRLRIMLPDEIGDTDALVLEGTSVWSGVDYDPSKFITGFSVAETKGTDTAVIDQIIERYGFVE